MARRKTKVEKAQQSIGISKSLSYITDKSERGMCATIKKPGRHRLNKIVKQLVPRQIVQHSSGKSPRQIIDNFQGFILNDLQFLTMRPSRALPNRSTIRQNWSND